MKYVIFQDESFALIPESAGHDIFKDMHPVSAGFCFIESYRNGFDDIRFRVSCYGESTSLKLKSREDEDALIIGRGMK